MAGDPQGLLARLKFSLKHNRENKKTKGEPVKFSQLSIWSVLKSEIKWRPEQKPLMMKRARLEVLEAAILTRMKSIRILSFNLNLTWTFPSSGTGSVRVVASLFTVVVSWTTSITAGFIKSSELRGPLS